MNALGHRYYPNALVSFVFGLFCVMLTLPPLNAFSDPDSGWHLMAGEYILSHGALPEFDPWSFSAGDYKWYNISWLFDVLIALANKAGGFSLLHFFLTVANAGICAVLAHVCLKRGAGFIATLLVVLLSGQLLRMGFLVRPQVVTNIMVLAFFLILSKDRESPRAYVVWLLPALMALWVNCHGGFVAGLMMIAAYCLDAVYERDFPRLKRSILLGGLCMLATLANPYGIFLYKAVWLTLGHFLVGYITEYRGLRVSEDVIATAYVSLFILSADFLNKRNSFAEKLLALFWLLWGIGSARYMSIAVMVTAPMLAVNLTNALHRVKNAAYFKSRDATFGADMERLVVRKWMAIAAIGAVALIASPYPKTLINKDGMDFPADKNPRGEVRFIMENYPGYKLWNDYNLGGFLIYESKGALKIFIDGRAGTAYPEQVTKDCIAVFELQDGWQDAIKRSKADGIILLNGSRLIQFLKEMPEWKMVHKGDVATIFVSKAL